MGNTDLLFSHSCIHILCFLLHFLNYYSPKHTIMLGKHTTSDMLPWLTTNCNWRWYKLITWCVDSNSFKCCVPPCPYSHLAALFNDYFWNSSNVWKIKCGKFVNSEIKYCLWIFSWGRSYNAVPHKCLPSWCRVGPVCWFTLLQKPVLCKVLDNLWASLGKWW
jgi:hypothetical protein